MNRKLKSVPNFDSLVLPSRACNKCPYKTKRLSDNFKCQVELSLEEAPGYCPEFP